MDEIEIFGFAPSTYTKTALIVAHEAGVSPKLQPLEFKQPSHFARHPYGKMPVLEHGRVKLFETLAIASYIDSAIGGRKLQPDDEAAHARMLQWISVAVDYAYEDLVNGLLADEPSPQAPNAAAEQLKLLDAGLGGSKYFAGAKPSLADCFLFPMVEFAVSKLGDGTLDGLRDLADWHRRMAARRSVKNSST
jgi:glutathione S-transferase